MHTGIGIDDHDGIEMFAGRDQAFEQPVQRRTLAGALSIDAFVDAHPMRSYDVGRPVVAVVSDDVNGEVI